MTGRDEHADHQLQEPPFPTAYHRPCRLAVLPVPVKPAAGGRNAAGARHRRVLRNDPALGPETRSAYAKRLRRKTPSREDIWHLEEVVVTIGGRKHWLWRAVDQDGYVLDEIVQTRRDTKAAKRLLIRLLKKQALAPKRIVTDKLRSYGAAKRDVMPAIEHRSHKGLSNRAENSHLPLRKRERVMQGFRSVGSLQQFVPVFSAVRNHFVPSHQKHSALATHIHRIRAMAHWKAVTGATA
ncbi:IS6 family transposase (plasmid) [Agrobacterium tumefaciens]|uniref:IS6 family transposase n=1 Tax=Agrobacterium tumefaciens TaxID=358 RepID=A0AAE6BU96_AGRTU|nr:IS6 family transposase [Agrobacterium tumefaciens]